MKKLFGKRTNKSATPQPPPLRSAPASPIQSNPIPARPIIKSAAAPAKPQQPVTPKKPAVTFTLLAPAARRVSLCGDFNDWSPDATPMTRQTDGQWTTALVLPPGRHQYKFVADGEWLHDPKAPEALPNLFGSLNSVIEVQA